MKSILKPIVFLQVTAALLLPALDFSASAAPPLPMRGYYEGFETGELDFPTLYVHGNSAGNATHLGRFTVTWDWVVDLPNLSGVGTIVFTAANGDSLFTFSDDAQGYPTEAPNVLRFTRTHIITGGTGRFAGASGSLYAEGFLVDETYNFLSFDGTIILEKGN
ncbi:MAG: hypothetical protein AB9869_19520 [Verrucomicrobiia bacterium]